MPQTLEYLPNMLNEIEQQIEDSVENQHLQRCMAKAQLAVARTNLAIAERLDYFLFLMTEKQKAATKSEHSEGEQGASKTA